MSADTTTPQTTPACAAAESTRPGSAGGVLSSFNRQFGRPEGPLGHLAGWIMARENVRANRLVVERLQIGPDDHVLEVGCGPGVALRAASERADRGLVVGIDPSLVMVGQARSRLRRSIRAGRCDVQCAPAEALPFPPASFTRAFTINTIDHWDSIPEGFEELSRVLAPAARLGIAQRRQRAEAGRDPLGHGASADDIRELCERLAGLGFREVRVEDHDLGRETLAIITATRKSD